MTVIQADFDYAAKIRKRGHRKTIGVFVRETAPFELADFTAEDAPVVLTQHKASKVRQDGAEYVRFVQDGTFAPVVDDDGQVVRTAEFDLATMKLRTELCETVVETIFLTGRKGVEIIRDPVQVGHHLLAADRDVYYADACRRVADSLVSINGILHMRIPEPMYVVMVEWTHEPKSKPAVLVDFDQTPGFRCPSGIESRGAIAHFRMDQREAADHMAEIVAEQLGFKSERELGKELAEKFDAAGLRAKMRRPNEPDVTDASLLRADPLRVTLEQSIHSLLHQGHEALVVAPDEFVLAWADMRESLALLESGHADAMAMAADAVRSFLAHAPATADQFVTGADKRRWETRTLPLLKGRTIVIEALVAMTSGYGVSDVDPTGVGSRSAMPAAH